MRANGGKLMAHECGEAVFVQLFGPLQLCIPKPCPSGPPFVVPPQLPPGCFLWLGVFWVFYGRGFPGCASAKGRMGAPALQYGAACDFSPPLASYVTFKLCLELPTLLLAGREHIFCNHLLLPALPSLPQPAPSNIPSRWTGCCHHLS